MYIEGILQSNNFSHHIICNMSCIMVVMNKIEEYVTYNNVILQFTNRVFIEDILQIVQSQIILHMSQHLQCGFVLWLY